LAGLTPINVDPAAILERVLGLPKVARIMAVLDTFGRAPGGLLANGLAFSTLFAAIPTLLLALGLAGVIAGDQAVVEKLTHALVEAFPPLADLIDSSMEALTKGAAATGLLGLIGVIWTVSQLYVTLDVAFARIFSAEPQRDVLRRTARGFVWVAILAACIIGLVVVASVATALDAIVPGSFPLAGEILSVVSSQVFLLGATIAGVAIVYRVMPPHAPHIRSLVPPAIVAGIAMWFLTQAFTFLVPRLVGVAALAGSLATAFIALAWLSFVFQALLYGAAWMKVREDERVGSESAVLGGPAAPAEPGGGGQ
jgi:YihY family inner membrane protein